jgi:crotonobetainyl-CoA:carnitine CoA-transferase CaiB-like acyl-CoA transferase
MPATAPRGAPKLGEHNDEIWGDLLSPKEYAEARDTGAI